MSPILELYSLLQYFFPAFLNPWLLQISLLFFHTRLTPSCALFLDHALVIHISLQLSCLPTCFSYLKYLASLSSTSLLWTVEPYSVMVGVDPRVHHFTKETPHLSDFWEITLCFTVWSLAFQLACSPGCAGSASFCPDSSAFSLLFSICLLIPYPQCEIFFFF